MQAIINYNNNIKVQVYCANISHKQGNDFFIEVSREKLINSVAEYCRENWNELLLTEEDNIEIPEDNEECIDLYFSYNDFHNEFVDYINTELDLVDVISQLNTNNIKNSDENSEEDNKQYKNFYYCARCNITWDDIWSCMCDDRCPKCDKSTEPYHSDEII